MGPSDIIGLLSGKRFTLNDEKKLQAELRSVLVDAYGERVEAEKRLDGRNIIDFFVSGIGIEVKVRGSKREIYKQCVRYCEFPEVKSLILVTGVMTGFPPSINNKDCYVFKLAQAWL